LINNSYGNELYLWKSSNSMRLFVDVLQKRKTSEKISRSIFCNIYINLVLYFR